MVALARSLFRGGANFTAHAISLSEGAAADPDRDALRSFRALGEQLTHRPQCVVQQRDQLPEQLLFALMEGAHLGPERLGALCSLALGLGVKRPFLQRLRLARRQCAVSA